MEALITLLAGLAFGGLVGYKYAKKKFSPKVVGGGGGGGRDEPHRTDVV